MSEKFEFKTKKEKNWLLNILRENDVTVKFTKKDGSDRTMICTLKEEKIPNEKLPKTAEKQKNEEVLPVFDLESQGWRSFRWDSIKEIHFSVHK
jgi:hypothetical protein